MPSQQMHQFWNCPYGTSDAKDGQHAAPGGQGQPQLKASALRHITSSGKYQHHVHGGVDERDRPVANDPRVEFVVVKRPFE